MTPLEPLLTPDAAAAPVPAAPVPAAPVPAAPADDVIASAAESEGAIESIEQAFPEIPPEVLAVPAVKWVLLGKPAGVRIPAGTYYPELRPVRKNLAALTDVGLGVYKSSAGDTVLFNPITMPPEEVETADRKGVLSQILPEYGQLAGSRPRGMTDEEADELLADEEQLQRDFAAREGASEPQMPATAPAAPVAPVSPPPAKAQAAINRERLAGLMPGSPSSGPMPGAGRIANAAAKPAI